MLPSRATPAVILAAATLAAIPFIPACTAPDDGAPAVVHRDSAGIAIVESARPAWGDSARWRVHPQPLLDLARSGEGPEHLFYEVSGMARLSDGTLVVANRGSNEIRWFSPDGRFVGAAGGHGEGPGEFDNLQRIELAGDTVLALDYDETIALFAPGPRLLRVLRTRHDSRSIHVLEGGRIVVATLLGRSEAYGQIRHPEALLLYDLEGRPGDSIGQVPGSEEYVGETLSGRPLFPRRSVLATRDASIYTGAADLMQVEELSATGDTVRILRIPGYPLALTEAQVEAEREARLNVPLPPGMTTLPPPLRQAIEDMPAAATRPAYDRIIVDPTGAVWVRHFTAQSERNAAGEGTSSDPLATALVGGSGGRGGLEVWLVFGPDGAWLGDVALPPDFSLMEVGTDQVLGVWSDPMDVQHPQVLRLTRDTHRQP